MLTRGAKSSPQPSTTHHAAPVLDALVAGKKEILSACQKDKKKHSGPNRSRTGDFGKTVFGQLQSYTLPLSYRPVSCFDE